MASKAEAEKERARKEKAVAAAQAALGGIGESQEFGLSGRAAQELEGNGRKRNKSLASLKSLMKRASRPSLNSLFGGLKTRLSLGSKKDVDEAAAAEVA